LCNVALESSTEPPVSSRYDAPVIAAERTKKWPREFRGHSNDFLRGYAKAYALDTKAYVLETKAYAPADTENALFRGGSKSTALRIAAIQARLATIQQDERLGVALAAHRGAGREGAGGFVG